MIEAPMRHDRDEERAGAADRRGGGLSARQGIRATTVSEVAEAAGVSRGWLYRHYPDKGVPAGAAIVRLQRGLLVGSHATLSAISGFEQLAVGCDWAAAPTRRRARWMAVAAGRTRGVRGVRGARRAGPGARPGPVLEALSGGGTGRGEIHPETELDEAARMGGPGADQPRHVPGDTLDPVTITTRCGAICGVTCCLR